MPVHLIGVASALEDFCQWIATGLRRGQQQIRSGHLVLPPFRGGNSNVDSRRRAAPKICADSKALVVVG